MPASKGSSLRVLLRNAALCLFLLGAFYATQTSQELVGQPRSGKWSGVRDAWVKDHPTCAACGVGGLVHVHHIKPFHLYPELELDRGNLITLCPWCHYNLGHDPDGYWGPERPSWSKYNPNIRQQAAKWPKKAR
jgi:5-methylcytosine-specific restriction endonuclease McrA